MQSRRSNATAHFTAERESRDQYIANVIGRGNVVRTFVIDRGHPAGAEDHTLTDTGIIVVRNHETHKLITELIARPRQISKLYESVGEPAPYWLIKLARQHNVDGENRR